MKIILLLFTLLFLCKTAFGQLLFYQDVFQGGTTGDAIGSYISDAPRNFILHIPPNSTIRKAYLFVTTYKTKYPNLDSVFYNRKIIFNGHKILLKPSDTIVNFSCYGSGQSYIDVGVIPLTVTNYIHPTQNVYTLIPPSNQLSVANTGVYFHFYLYITYNNPNMSKISTSVIINEQDAAQNVTYLCDDLNKIDTTKDVGFAFHSTAFCDTTQDGSYVYCNNHLLGLTGGQENNIDPLCAGVWGSFYYQNDTLYGLGNDIPDSLMEGPDALANIQSFITDPNQFNISFEYQDPNYAPRTNPILQLFFAYSTPCDTFSVTVSNDTTICHGETLQLHASGGTQYEWSATSGGQAALNALSCTNCPNPVFSGDTSRVYTVRIWNTDSCSVVRPVRITVSPPLEKAQFGTSPAICGVKNNGRIFLSGAQPSLWDTLWAVNAAGDTLQTAGTTLSNLSPGDYTVFYTNSYGCSSADTVVNVGATIITEAAFDTHPDKGKAPLQVDVENLSSNATDYSWWLNGTYQGNNFSGFLADTSGTYHIQLIAWNNDSLCADTASLTVLVYDSLVTRIPNVFTPNGDGVNDHFTVTVNLPVQTTLVILNRWGNVVHEWEGMLEEGKNVLWDSTSAGGLGHGSAKVSDGTYFYKLVFSDLPGKEKTRKATGYVEVLR